MQTREMKGPWSCREAHAAAQEAVSDCEIGRQTLSAGSCATGGGGPVLVCPPWPSEHSRYKHDESRCFEVLWASARDTGDRGWVSGDTRDSESSTSARPRGVVGEEAGAAARGALPGAKAPLSLAWQHPSEATGGRAVQYLSVLPNETAASGARESRVEHQGGARPLPLAPIDPGDWRSRRTRVG